MRSCQSTIVILVMVIAVVTIFVTPGIDLPKTALRAQQAANLLLSNVATTALTLNSLDPPTPSGLALSAFVPFVDHPGRYLLTTNCTMIC